MKPVFTVMALGSCLAVAGHLATVEDSSVLGIFKGTTPCGQMIRPLHRVAGQADCALVESLPGPCYLEAHNL